MKWIITVRVGQQTETYTGLERATIEDAIAWSKAQTADKHKIKPWQVQCIMAVQDPS